MQGPVGLAKRVGRDQLGQGRVPAAFVEMRRERPAHITKHQGKSDLSAKVADGQAQALIPTTILHLSQPADRARSGAQHVRDSRGQGETELGSCRLEVARFGWLWPEIAHGPRSEEHTSE